MEVDSQAEAVEASTDRRNGPEVLGLRSQYLQKEFITERGDNYEVDAVRFSIMSAEEITKYSSLKVCNKELYYPMTNQPMPFGVLDSRLGANKASGQCRTCGNAFQECCGHWGHVDLYHPVFHVGYFKHLINLLYCICKRCAKLLLTDVDRKLYLQRVRRCHDPIMKRALLKRIVVKCKRESLCLDPECQAPQGMLRRVMKPALDQFMKIILQMKVKRDGPGTAASRTTVVNEDLDARYIKNLLQKIPALDCEVLDVSQPEKYLVSSLLVPPKCIRPSVTLGDAGTNEDDLTVVFSEIIDLNNILAAQSAAGFLSPSVLGNWEFLQLQCTRFVNSEAPSVGALLATKNISSPGRGICQRLKGKEGRFRGNLSGKRVDFSGRTVISPDANCPIHEVVIPMWSAKRLTFPERVCEVTMDRLRAAVLKGADEWPGASFVLKKDGGKSSLRFANRKQVAENLQIGDVVERHLWNGDIVLFNRQPSLHRLSIMAHKARVMPWRTFRFNECVCTPYNADFDGDEMNCHLPQTQEARAEAYHLMGVVNNLVTPKNGEPLIAATQDFLSGSYLLSHKDTFLTRDRFTLYCCYFTDGKARIDIPPPTILKPVELWTGKQVIGVLLRPNLECRNVVVSFELREREFERPAEREPDFMCRREGYVLFQNSELICGALAKSTLGNGSKKGLFFNLIRDNSPQVAAACMGRVAKLAGRWFANRGMTIGIDDVTPGPLVRAAKKALLEKGFNSVQEEIANYEKGNMQPNPGCTLEETIETRVKSILDDLRTVAGQATQDNLPPTNKPLIMFLSGAKGALINIAQMIALVGQQNVGGQRIQNGFVDRTLPHFKPKSQDGKARGFVAHSFYDGLDPDEFFFHTMSGREGLVDTAVKTAETGYMQRRLVKALEDLSCRYDRTVRTSDGQIVQFVYGDDGLNPAVMEDKASPMKLDKVYEHINSLTHVCTKLETLELSTVDQATETTFDNPHNPDIIVPPTTSDDSFLNIRLKSHFAAIDKRIAQQQKTIRQRLAGLGATNSTKSEIKTRIREGDDTGRVSVKKRIIESEGQMFAKSVTGVSNGSNFSVSTTAVSEAPPVPRSVEEKLRVLRSWQKSDRFRDNQELMEKDPTYLQAKGNILAQVVVNEWLPPMKQHAPLLPYEIKLWGAYLLQRTAELLPEPLSDHLKICLTEKPTHQPLTAEVKIFSNDLQKWVDAKATDVAKYRTENNMHAGDTPESYKLAISALRINIPCETERRVVKSEDGTGSHLQTSFPKLPLARRSWVIPSPADPVPIKVEEPYASEEDLLGGNRRRQVVENSMGSESEQPSQAHREATLGEVDYKKRKRRWRYSRHYWVTTRHLLEFFRLAWRKYNRALTEPGEAVGATGAQSIGEPGTQMTLKTFHFAGVASMNVTLGVPRIKEIINAANKIMTPIIQVPLIEDTHFDYALMVKSRIEKTLLGEVCVSIKEVYSPEGAFLSIKLCKETISKLFLNVTAETVRESILSHTGLLGTRLRLKEELVEVSSEYKLIVRPPSTEALFFDLQLLKQRLQEVCLCGLSGIKRGVIKKEQKKAKDGTEYCSYGLAVEGYGLRDVMATTGVLGTSCTSNHVMEVKDILGIEAARRVIIDEIRGCMEAYSMDIDCRHMQLLGDVMTFRGDVLGISRFGIMKMRASTLMLASFEETNEHLFEAAAHNRQDSVTGVSESIIMGKAVTLGTGAFDILYDFNNQWTGKALDGETVRTKRKLYAQRSTLLLSKYGRPA